MAKFTKDMIVAVKALKAPYPGLAFDLVEFPDYLAIRVYENQIMSLPDGYQVSVMEYLHQMRNLLISFGAEKVYFDGAKGDPPRGGLR